ncbi:hypothetical protein CB1_001161021 [Camelus ferus]|nr:hypothetical protein CB1_001161021 [Camelus ferus]
MKPITLILLQEASTSRGEGVGLEKPTELFPGSPETPLSQWISSLVASPHTQGRKKCREGTSPMPQDSTTTPPGAIRTSRSVKTGPVFVSLCPSRCPRHLACSLTRLKVEMQDLSGRELGPQKE